MICRDCKNAIIPPYTNDKVDQRGNESMVKMGYRQCSAAKTPEEKARWLTGGCECVYPDRSKAK